MLRWNQKWYQSYFDTDAWLALMIPIFHLIRSLVSGLVRVFHNPRPPLVEPATHNICHKWRVSLTCVMLTSRFLPGRKKKGYYLFSRLQRKQQQCVKRCIDCFLFKARRPFLSRVGALRADCIAI